MDYARGILRDGNSFTLYTCGDNIYNYSYPYIFQPLEENFANFLLEGFILNFYHRFEKKKRVKCKKKENKENMILIGEEEDAKMVIMVFGY